MDTELELGTLPADTVTVPPLPTDLVQALSE
jgi:hypothetical protein